MRIGRLNGGQRIIVVIGIGIALYLFGEWLIGFWEGGSFGWVGYAPLSQAPLPSVVVLHPWVRLLIWLAITAIWVIASLGIMSTRRRDSGKGASGKGLVEH
jgi:hypothetical protein